MMTDNGKLAFEFVLYLQESKFVKISSFLYKKISKE